MNLHGSKNKPEFLISIKSQPSVVDYFATLIGIGQQMKTYTKNILFVAITAALAAPAYALKPADEAIIELYQQVEDLQHDVNSLRGTNEQLRHELDKLKKSQETSQAALRKRISSLEDQLENSSSNASSDGNDDKAETEAEKEKSDSTIVDEKSDNSDSSVDRKVSDKVAYKRAYDLLSEDPDAAVADLEDFLKEYPSSPLAANAHYWIAETWYSKGEYEKAKDNFLKVLKDYKGSNKESAAALKLGYTFVQMKQWDYAKKTLKDVIHFFPDTHEAELAKSKLAAIKDK